MSKKVIGILIGSLRRESYNKKIARHIVKLSPDGFEFRILEIGDLPLYNQDYDDDGKAPESYNEFRKTAREIDGFIFVTAEYNRSVPAVLKNALDVGSRPYGKSVWDGKPGAIISSSIGGIGGFGANHHLRQSMTFLNVLMLQQPESYIGNVAELMDDKGNITNQRTIESLQNFVDAYIKWVKQVSA
ncbi:MAG: NADPH-dependent FMN reductase [Dysgonomonas sp.]